MVCFSDGMVGLSDGMVWLSDGMMWLSKWDGVIKQMGWCDKANGVMWLGHG